MTGRQIAPEFSLLVQCCRWNFVCADAQAPLDIPTDIDWSLFVALARRHRVQGLAWNTLAQHGDRLPGDAKLMLSSDAKSIAAANLAMTAECLGLRKDFEQAGVALLFVKGLTVGALAYRSPMLKMGWDIDLLVDPSDLAMAARLLSGRRYSLELPSTRAQLQTWHVRSKESVWHRTPNFHVELHTRLADSPHLIPDIDVHSPQQMIEVAGAGLLPTLAEDELFAYLAVHGAWSAWFRLKWISDFAAVAYGRTANEIERLYDRSQDLGAARAAGQALLLADRLFDVLHSAPSLRDRLVADRTNRLLSDTALRVMTSGIAEPTERTLGTLTIHWAQFFLQHGLGYKFSEFTRQSVDLVNRLAR